MSTAHWFLVGEVPDVREHRMTMRCAGAPRPFIFDAGAALLRTVARFEPGEVTLTMRGEFDPGGVALQDRLRWYLRCDIDQARSDEVRRLLGEDGPLGPFYPLERVAPPPPRRSRVVADVVRRQEMLQPLVSAAQNPNVAVLPLYVAFHAFEAREDNDWMALDRLLSRHPHPAAFEVRVAPVDARPMRHRALKLLADLRAINAFDDRDAWSSAALLELARESPEAHRGDRPRETRLRDPLADEVAMESQRTYERLRRPQLAFSMRVFADEPAEARAIATCLGESAFANGSYDVLLVDGARGPAHASWVAGAMSRSVSGEVVVEEDGGRPDDEPTWSQFIRSFAARARPIGRIASVDEAVAAFRLPVAGELSPSTFRKSTDPRPGSAGERRIVLGIDEDIGMDAPLPAGLRGVREVCELAGRAAPLVELPVDALCKHLFICGVPGSGKTTAMFNLIAQLWACGVPTLVIETAKTEYRVLKTMTDHPDEDVRRLAAEMRVYTPGNDGLSPLRLNPFEYDESVVSRDEHIDNLMACFRGGLPGFDGYIEAILTDAVDRAYQEGDAEKRVPKMTDLAHWVPIVADEKGYAGDVASNMQAILDVRMGILTSRGVGRIFAQRESAPSIRDLMSFPTVIELEHAGPKTAGLLTLFLLSALREHIKADPRRLPNGGLAHAIIVEEAHNLVGRASRETAEGSGNAAAEATAFVTRMLAEMRALGEGIVIADQLPTAVAPEVIRHTGTKVAARLVSREDREEIGWSMLLDEAQIEEIARLAPGEAYVYADGFHVPRRTKTLDASTYLGLRGRYPAGMQLLEHLHEAPWFEGIVRADLEALSRRDAEWRAWLGNKRAEVEASAGSKLARIRSLLADEPDAGEAARQSLADDLSTPLVEADAESRALRLQRQRMQPRAAAAALEEHTLPSSEADLAAYEVAIAPWRERLQELKSRVR